MNMSYCRFRNTVLALRDCQDNIYDDLDSNEEKDAKEQLIEMCKEIAYEFNDEDDEY